MRQLVAYGIIVLGVAAAFTVIHVMVRPITPLLLVYMAVLAIMIWGIGSAIDWWSRRK